MKFHGNLFESEAVYNAMLLQLKGGKEPSFCGKTLWRQQKETQKNVRTLASEIVLFSSREKRVQFFLILFNFLLDTFYVFQLDPILFASPCLFRTPFQFSEPLHSSQNHHK